MTGWHVRQAAGTARVVQHPAVLGDIGDAVLQQDEHVVAVVDAQPVAGAEVLIDPRTMATLPAVLLG